jgi:hypothetical protein
MKLSKRHDAGESQKKKNLCQQKREKYTLHIFEDPQLRASKKVLSKISRTILISFLFFWFVFELNTPWIFSMLGSHRHFSISTRSTLQSKSLSNISIFLIDRIKSQNT